MDECVTLGTRGWNADTLGKSVIEHFRYVSLNFFVESLGHKLYGLRLACGIIREIVSSESQSYIAKTDLRHVTCHAFSAA